MKLSGKVTDLFNNIAGFADFVSGYFCPNTYSLSYVTKVEAEVKVEVKVEAKVEAKVEVEVGV